MGEGVGQQYCLRWNNHSSNFVTVFEQLLKAGAFTDVTVVSYDGPAIKCHKMVLAACSAYFQELFMKNSCEHPIIILSNVKHIELEAILNYMYRGEVNIERNDLEELLKVAEFLKVKGLVEESQLKCEDSSMSPAPVSGAASSTTNNGATAHSAGYISPSHHLAAAAAAAAAASNYMNFSKSALEKSQHQHQQHQAHMPYWGLAAFPGMPKPQHVYDDKPLAAEAPALHQQLQLPQHPILSSSYESATESSPLTKKKKHSSHLHSNAILRSVLADSNQPMGLEHERADLSYESPHNGSRRDSDRRNSAETSEEERRNSSPRNYTLSSKSGCSSSTRPEWKRYKQYTRENIMDAMTAVREKKMSALQAARQYKVPSRTLYDKLKKAGILPSRNLAPRASGAASISSVGLESSARFPYSASINGSVYGHGSNSNGPAAGTRAGSVCCDNGSEHENEMLNGYASDSYARDQEFMAGSSGGCDTESHDDAMDMSRRSASPPEQQQQQQQQQQPEPCSSVPLNVEVAIVNDEVEDLSVYRAAPLKKEIEEEEEEEDDEQLADKASSNDVSVIVPAVKSLLVKKEEDPASLEDSSSRA